MSTPVEATLTLLKSIDASLKRIERLMSSPGQQASHGPDVADDRDLDGKYGDEEIRFDPRDWSGQSYKKRRMSECPAEFLDLYAEAKEYFGRKADEEGKVSNNSGKPIGPYERKSAARARGWAARIRSGRHTPRHEAPTTPGWGASAGSGWAGPASNGHGGDPVEPLDDSDIPF